MMKKSWWLAGVLALAVSGVQAEELYQVDAYHSSIGFSVRHMMVSNVKGRFTKFSGAIALDPKDVTKSSVKVSLEVASVNTDIEARDKHLRGADFFDVDKFPTATFTSQKVEKSADGYVLAGDLTLKGVTRPVRIPFTLSGPVKDPKNGGQRIGASGRVVINRQDFGLTYNTILDTGGLAIGNDVTLELEIEGVMEGGKK